MKINLKLKRGKHLFSHFPLAIAIVISSILTVLTSCSSLEPDISTPGKGTLSEKSVASVTKTSDGLMTYSGLTVVSYGGYLNGESFQQDGILTYNGYQYTCFWNTARRVILARRSLPNGSWAKIEISSYTNTANDAHNTISLGICPNDGTLHVAFDHHGNDLHYIKSVQGLVTNPSGMAWATSSFGAVTSTLSGSTVTLVTYPRFITTPQGNLLFEYRYGTSGSGDQYLYEYSGSTHTWTSIGKYIDGISSSINAYPHGISYTPNGSRLHMSWCWRETPDASTNHDLFYIYSDDNGRTWFNNSGAQIATTGSSYITPSSPGIKVWTINQNRGLINQEHMAVDNAGRVHVLLSHMPDSQANDTDFTSARTKSQYFHYWRATNGTWTRTPMNFSVIQNFRGKLAITSNNDIYGILPNLRIAAASASTNWTDWTMTDMRESGRFFSDPLIDASRLKIEDVLTVYLPAANSSNIYTLDYTLNPPGSSASIESGGTYMITARHSGKVLDVRASDNSLIQYSYWGGDNQRWILTGVGSGYYRISPISNSSYALDVAGVSTSDGANVQISSYTGGTNQQWQFVNLGNGYYRIQNRNSGKCLDVYQQSTANAANVAQWSYWGGQNQQFYITRL